MNLLVHNQIKSRCSDGFVYALEPTPECWNLALKHRTQIVHDLDASIVNFYLDLKPGSIVVESGTGSGAMSVGLCRALAPTGHLYTFEFNESRANIAREEFGVLGLSSLVTVTHRDVCGKDGQGGGFADIVGCEAADAVFLDLPHRGMADAIDRKENGIGPAHQPRQRAQVFFDAAVMRK